MNWILILIATLTTFALGALWYGPLFGKAWGRASGIDMSKKHGHPAKVFGFSFVFAAIAAAAYVHLAGSHDDVLGATLHGAVVGFCFAATSFGINYQFANRGWSLWLIDGGYHTVQFALYGLVYSALHGVL